MNQPEKESSATPTDQSAASEPTPVDWQAKYQKEHDLKKKLNKQKKKAYKNVKKLTQENQVLKEKLDKLKAATFIREHDYF